MTHADAQQAQDAEDTANTPNPVDGSPGVKDRVMARFRAYRDEHAWLQHVIDAWNLLQRNHGNQYAGAITYFSFLALFPLLLLAVSVTGFVLRANPGTEASLFAHITAQVPGPFGQTLKDAITSAINARTGVGVIGLVGVLLTGLGWISNLREALDAVWGAARSKRNVVTEKLANLLVLGGLGLGTVASLAVTAVGTSLTEQILTAIGLNDVPGSVVVLKVLGIAIAVVGDSIIFWWVLIRLSDVHPGRRTAIGGVVMASIGFEVLKILGTYTIAHTAHSPTAGPFAGIVAILVWIQLVARWMLFCCAWMATAPGDGGPEPESEPAGEAPAEAPPARPENEQSSVTPAAVGATLVGAGALAGAVATFAATRGRSGSRPS